MCCQLRLIIHSMCLVCLFLQHLLDCLINWFLVSSMSGKYSARVLMLCSFPNYFHVYLINTFFISSKFNWFTIAKLIEIIIIWRGEFYACISPDLYDYTRVYHWYLFSWSLLVYQVCKLRQKVKLWIDYSRIDWILSCGWK